MKEKKVSKFSWVYPFIIFSYLVFLGVFLIHYQVRVHKLEKQVINLEAYNEELIYELDDLFDDLDDEFMFIENDIVKLNKHIDKLEDELNAELTEDYYALVAEKAILEDRLNQAKLEIPKCPVCECNDEYAFYVEYNGFIYCDDCIINVLLEDNVIHYLEPKDNEEKRNE